MRPSRVCLYRATCHSSSAFQLEPQSDQPNHRSGACNPSTSITNGISPHQTPLPRLSSWPCSPPRSGESSAPPPAFLFLQLRHAPSSVLSSSLPVASNNILWRPLPSVNYLSADSRPRRLRSLPIVQIHRRKIPPLARLPRGNLLPVRPRKAKPPRMNPPRVKLPRGRRQPKL